MIPLLSTLRGPFPTASFPLPPLFSIPLPLGLMLYGFLRERGEAVERPKLGSLAVNPAG